MNNMCSISILFRPLPGQTERLIDACLAAVEPSRREPGCLFFDLLVGDGDTPEILFYEAYRDQEAFNAHMEAPHTKAWQAAALPLIDRGTIRFPAHRGRAQPPTYT